MRAILYCPDDRNMVQTIRDFLAHISDCPGCTSFAATDTGRANLDKLVGYVDCISGDDLTADDIPSVIEFCDAWLGMDELLCGLDCLTVEFAEPINGRRTGH